LDYFPSFMAETLRQMNEFIVHARPIYIQAIEPWIGKPVIKILTGMRRGPSQPCGRAAYT